MKDHLSMYTTSGTASKKVKQLYISLTNKLQSTLR